MKKDLIVLQEEVSDCGICSLASIIKFYGGDVSLELLRYYTNTNQEGTNAYELINCAKRLGFNAYGEKTDNLVIDQPVIAHLKLNNDFFHFVVLYKTKKNYLIIMDPSCGVKKMLISDFKKVYTGVIIRFIPLNEIAQYKKNRFLLDSFLDEIKYNKKKYIFLIFISMFILLLTLLNNFNIKILTLNNKYIYILLLFFIINQTLIYFKNKILLKYSIKFNNKNIGYFVNHIFKLPLYYLRLKQKGEISTRFNELNNLTNSILEFSINIIYDFILLLLILIIIFLFSIKIFFILILFSIIYIFINIIIYNKLINEIKYSVNLEESYNSNILDYISNFNTIKHLNIYKYFTKNILNNLDDRNKVVCKINNKIYLINYINELLLGILLLMVIYMIILLTDSLSNGMVIYLLFDFYLNTIKLLVNSYPTILIYKTIINKSDEFLSIKINTKKNVFDFQKIIIDNLKYVSINKIILNNLCLEINKKDKIFLSGPSGIGKSTFLRILNNEINRYNGDILIDSVNLRGLNVSNLITYVSQDESLFNDTIYNNLVLGENISEVIIEDATKVCRLNDINVIDKVGLNSLIINDSSLSGGERNRIVLARSLIHSKEILILDEVLKEIDKELEEQIIKDVLRYFKDKTIIYVSHKNVGYLFDKVLTF